jgi:cysteine desulfurase
VYFHCDGMQAAGKIPVCLRSLDPDFYAVSGHKFHGPKGSGALYVSHRVPAGALFHGGDQEFGRRAGTENVAAIAGLGMAAEKAKEFLAEPTSFFPDFLKVIEDKVVAALPHARFLASSAPRLPNTRLLLHSGIEAEAAIALLDERGICISSGSACASGSPEPSHVLRAMGVPKTEVRSALRLSASRLNTSEEAAQVGDSLVDIIRRLGAMNP